MWKTKIKNQIKEHVGWTIFICTVITIACLGGIFGMYQRSSGDIQKNIAQEIVRFHVLGNSDSDQDQTLKMQVKEQVIDYLQGALKEADNVEDTKVILKQELSAIEEKANEVIKKAGYEYTASASMTTCYFPMKSYGDCTFPAGDYEALRICLGEAKGKNWWCVLYPNLCFIDSLHAVVPTEQKQELKGVLTEEEYDSLFVKSKLLETIRDAVF